MIIAAMIIGVFTLALLYLTIGYIVAKVVIHLIKMDWRDRDGFTFVCTWLWPFVVAVFAIKPICSIPQTIFTFLRNRKILWLDKLTRVD